MKKPTRSVINKDLISLMPPRLDLQNLGWTLEEYWENPERDFFARSRNSYGLQLHRPALDFGKCKIQHTRPIGRWILATSSGEHIAWAECEGIQGTYLKISLLFGSQDSQNAVWREQGKAAIELLIAALAILLSPDEASLTAINREDLGTLAAWSLGSPQPIFSPVIDALYRPHTEPLASWQHFSFDLRQFEDSENGQSASKALNYLQLRKTRALSSLNRLSAPRPRRGGFLAKLFRGLSIKRR